MGQEQVTKRFLPHWYQPGAAHFVTFRLANSLPQEVLAELREHKARLMERRAKLTEPLSDTHKRLFAIYDDYLDHGTGEPWLSDPRIASLVRGSLYFLHEKQFALLAYTIMPNHAHVLFVPRESTDETREPDECVVGEQADGASPLAKIMHSLKSYTAHEANRILRRSGSFWQRESYDHWVRDDDELERIVAYINANPVKAGLVARATDWFWGSAHDRFLRDGDTSGWLGLVEPLK